MDLRIGIIGLGCIAHIRYIPTLSAMAGVRIWAVCDIDPDRARQVGGQLNVPFFCDVDAFLAQPDLDAVVVTTGHATHAPLIEKALLSGKHVLVEKPIAVGMEELWRIQRAHARSDKVLFALPYDQYPHVDQAKRYIDQGVIGQVCTVDGNFAHLGPAHAPWFFDRDKARWGVMADLGIYLISAYAYLFGPIRRITGYTKRVLDARRDGQGRPFPVTVEDNCAALLDWGDGKIGVMKANWATGIAHPNCLWNLTISGTEGILYLDMVAPRDKLIVYSPNRPVPGATAMDKKDHYRAQTVESDVDRDIVAAFVAAIRSPGHGSLALQAHVIQAIARLYESAERGCSVQIDSRF